VELAQRNPQEVLDSCTVPLWKVLSEWLFEHRQAPEIAAEKKKKKKELTNTAAPQV